MSTVLAITGSVLGDGVAAPAPADDRGVERQINTGAAVRHSGAAPPILGEVEADVLETPRPPTTTVVASPPSPDGMAEGEEEMAHVSFARRLATMLTPRSYALRSAGPVDGD